MEKYKCEICGKKHPIYTSIDVPLPRIISEMSDEEKAKLIKEYNGLYYPDGKLLYINGWVVVEVENYEYPFYSWKTWSSISTERFLQKMEELKTGKIVKFSGKLEEDLPFYPNSKDLKTQTLIYATNEEIVVEIKIIEDSKLKEDQSKPISEKRMIEIMQMLHHRPVTDKEVSKLDKIFKERLVDELRNAEEKYIKNEKDFVIDLSTGTVLFQVVSNKMLEISGNRERGFGLHLSFDESNDESQEEITKFKSKGYSNEFNYHDLDEIPTYQIDLGMDRIRLVKLVQAIVKDVYEEDLETVKIDNFEM
ncbi:MAG: hypothetical protein ACI85O_001091 [Saprospiraceae bacterium]|jgi:hypothetical protein